MKDFAVLKFLDRFEKLFGRLGIDYFALRKILQVKLTLDGRRVPTVFASNTENKNKKDSNQYIKSLWIYVLFGAFTVPFIIMSDNYFLTMSLYFGVFTFFTMTTMIADFSSVLLDVRDRPILFPKPVNKKTITAAKIIHILIYLTMLTGALAVIPLVIGLVNHGFIFFIGMLVNIILIDVFVIAITAIIYMLILRFFDGEKLKDIINYVQIGLSLGMMVGYQLLIRVFDVVNINVEVRHKWWEVFIFPVWNGAIMELIMNRAGDSFLVALASLGIIVPIAAILIYSKLVPSFERSLQKLTYAEKAKEKRKNRWSKQILKLICPTKEELTFYQFTRKMIKNERDFKLKTYPLLGFSFVAPFLFFMNMLTSNEPVQLEGTKNYLYIYFTFLMLPTIIFLMRNSTKYKGAWIYQVTPIKHLKPIFSGSVKAIFLSFYFPIWFILSLIFVVIFSPSIIPSLVIVLINAIIYTMINFMVYGKAIPFSKPFDASTQTSTIISFLLMFVALIFVGVHFLVLSIPYGEIIYIVISTLVVWILWKVAFNISWRQIKIK